MNVRFRPIGTPAPVARVPKAKQAKYRWVIVFRDGTVRNEPVARGAREAAYFGSLHAGRPYADVAEVQRHLSGDAGFIYRRWRMR
jgi:hypothetical protein